MSKYIENMDAQAEFEMHQEEQIAMKQNILNTVSDLVGRFMYYDRKEDEDLPRGAIEQAIKDGVITKQEIVDAFAKDLLDD